MKRHLMLALFLALACLTGFVSAQTPEPTQTPQPTQTPYIIYVVVTATPTPEPEPTVEPIQIVQVEDVPLISRSAENPAISLVNNGSSANPGAAGNVISIVNSDGASGGFAISVDELVERVVATVSADANTAVGSNNFIGSGNTAGGAVVHLADGSTCTMNFTLLSEPTYPAGAIVPCGEIFWKEWLIQNTGTCTWTADWEFVFNSGWQIGNTRFHMNRTTAPGETLNVRLAMVPDQKQDGNYYSTYIFEAPDGTQYGTITSSYTVKPISYFAKPTEKACENCKPKHEPWFYKHDDHCYPPPPPWW